MTENPSFLFKTILKEEMQGYFKRFNEEYGIDNFTFYNYSYLDIINDSVYLFIYKNNKVEVKVLPFYQLWIY